MLQVIPRPVHAVLDYVYGVTALMAPKLMGFENDERGKMASTAMGLGAIVSAAATHHEGGLIKLVPFSTHLKMDVAHAALSLALPWLAGFSRNPRARNTAIGLALLEVVVVMLSQPDRE